MNSAVPLLLHKTRFGWGVWGSGRDDSDNNRSRTFQPKALTFYLFNLQLSSKVGCSIFTEKESKDFQVTSPKSQEEPSEGLSNPYSWKWRDQDPGPGGALKCRLPVNCSTDSWPFAVQRTRALALNLRIVSWFAGSVQLLRTFLHLSSHDNMKRARL